MIFPEKIKNIIKSDSVLEIGPGASPFWRSDVYLDRNFSKEEEKKQRGVRDQIRYNKPIFYYDGKEFPFKNKEFDYIICSHVIEHVEDENIDIFFSEMQRVAKKGYIEVPTLFYEYLFNFHVHKWMINIKDNQIILMNKKYFSFSLVNDVFYNLLKHGFKNKRSNILNDFKRLFFEGVEWENTLDYKIVKNISELLNNDDINKYLDYFKNINRYKEALGKKIINKIINIFKGIK